LLTTNSKAVPVLQEIDLVNRKGGVSRRQFLVQAGSLAAGALVTSAVPHSVWAYPLGLPPGIELYTVRTDLGQDAPGTLKQIAAIGYKEVEPAGFGSLKTASEFRKALDDNGLKCPSAHLEFNLDNLQKTFDDANALGCTYATCSVPGMMIMPAEPPASGEAPSQRRMQQILAPLTPDQFKKLAAVLNTVGAAAKKAGLTYASHNHTMEFAPMDGKPGYDYLLQHTDPALVKFELDCGWATVAGYKPSDFLTKYPGRIKMLHMSDYLAPRSGLPVSPLTSAGTELGTGIVDYKPIFAAARGHGIEHVFVEQFGPYSRMSQMEAAKTDYAFLRSFAG
jgi:sugar phosphate isomerase/epimerase